MEEVQNTLKHEYFVVYAYRNVYKAFLFFLFQKCIVSIIQTTQRMNQRLESHLTSTAQKSMT